jgi:hypothetical protein
MDERTRIDDQTDDCVVPSDPVPACDLAKYAVDHDVHSAADIRRYVEIEAADETVQHVEKVKQEYVLGDVFEIWDVTTDKDRWWVMTNLTNLYSQRHFQSLDYALSFHIGLMMRLRSRPNNADANESTPFDEVFRRQAQAKDRFDRAVESEDYQAVGMQLRECLISLVAASRRRVELKPDLEQPQAANVVAWSSLLIDTLCGGGCNRELRHYLKNAAKDAWQLANWITHDRNASELPARCHSCVRYSGWKLHCACRERKEL